MSAQTAATTASSCRLGTLQHQVNRAAALKALKAAAIGEVSEPAGISQTLEVHLEHHDTVEEERGRQQR
eukprot:CAMPEP_0202045986 /NCGR_PEP_ID=MMETSP0963-20130614/1031_1 /ASSEMBLY_ACC=CAM_ASM_000494 /TAXON_ID=4773 /ORGANISM="Schizochytrium aggregatum, Strain ATCC28209" /LENGTH=68 /DNA_ID=CAMNT_0048610605 /DNA_START=185 /DNA_END=391 /DNA_ORIENTATION=-